MGWQLIFKAPDGEERSFDEPTQPAPGARRPVSMTLQLEPGTMVVRPSGEEEEDDDVVD